MSQKNRADLNAESAVIRDETTANANTATRVGAHQVNQNDSNLNLIETSDQSVVSKVEFKSQAHANNSAGVVISFSATPTFNFNNGNDQEMPVEGNVTTFSTSNEAGSANYKVWLITDGSVRTVSAPVGWTKAASSDDHDTAANSINLYQFFTRPGGVEKYYSILNV